MLVSIFLLSSINTCLSQKFDFKIYRWEEVQNANPDTIYGLTFAKEKRTELPTELSKFVNLRYLNLNKNKIQSLPEYFDTLKRLEVFEAEKNDFIYFMDRNYINASKIVNKILKIIKIKLILCLQFFSKNPI